MGDAQRLWSECCTLLRDRVGEGVWMSTFQGAVPVTLDHDRLVLGVPNHRAKDGVESTYRSLVDDALRSASGTDVELRVEIRTAAPSAPVTADPLDDLLGVDTGRAHRANPPDAPPAPVPGVRESPRYTFEAFVTGPSNRFAHAAALSVAETPGRNYNPLFIYGEAGLGKTHLLQAIAHYVRENYPDRPARYIPCENLLNEFVESVRFSKVSEFKKRWREVDVLLVDDIQFIERGDRFQEEFFHTFNELHDRMSQIVLTSDRPPDAMSTIEQRLRSRFKMGLITDIQPPDVETRLAILRKKAEQTPAWVPDEVLDFIATNITDNIRELEGALTRVAAYANLYQVKLDVPEAERILSDIIGDRQPRPITAQLILDKTADMYGFTVEEITSKSRQRPLVTARQVGMYVVRELTDLSYPNIGRVFGDRDHTTVMHAVEKIGALMQERKQIFHQVQALVQDVRKG